MILKKGTSGERRVAAEALGRIGDQSVIPDLLKAAAQAEDRFLEHSIIYALIELNDIPATEQGLGSDNPRVRRAALIAIDQMPGGGLKSDQVIPLLASNRDIDQDTANWLLKQHPEWGDDLAGWFTRQFEQLPTTRTKPGGAQVARLESQLSLFTGSPVIQELLAIVAIEDDAHPAARSLALRVMAKTKVAEMPRLWADTLVVLLDPNSTLIAQAVAVARSLPPTKEPHEDFQAALWRIGTMDEQPAPIRLDAFAAIPNGVADPSRRILR